MTFDRAIQAKLDSIDWSFPTAEMSAGIHSLHPYPARFIPEIPRELIRLFHQECGGAVLDPFCGSGTTLVESVFAGIPSCGIDVNPLAILIAKVRTTALRSSTMAVAERIAANAQRTKHQVPPIPRIDHWFKPDVQSAIAQLAVAIDTVEDADTRDALRIALSRIIVRVSNQESDTRYAAIEKNVSRESVLKLFLGSAAFVDESLRKAYGFLADPLPSRFLIHADVLGVSERDVPHRCGLVVTSPPYPNAYEYWLYHKYRMYWLGMDPLEVRAREIGARPHYFKKNHQTEVDFERQMDAVFALIASVALTGALACFLVGDSLIHGRLIDNSRILRRSAVRSGLVPVASAVRSIEPTRKSFNLAHARIRQERIEVFRFEG
jgi:site-specific DNA-methyltransferase (cytosine-N4-specific)